MTMMPDLCADSVKMLVSDTLRLFVGHGRRFSWADLALATGDDERKLRAYVESDPRAMPADVFLRVFAVLPPEALARVMARIGYGVAPLEADAISTVRQSLAQCARLVSHGMDYLADDRLTPQERANLAAEATALLPALQALANIGAAGP
jgi:hypothetical protein